MPPSVYLTIDDSPSALCGELTEFLANNGLPALLFCRGDLMESRPAAVADAIGKGLVIASHNYSHTPAGAMSYEQIVEEIERTEVLIEAAYRQAGVARPGKYFRFPYLDRGDGDRLEQRFAQIIAAADTLRLDGDKKVARLQEYLKREGFTQPFAGVTHPLYQNRDVAQAADCFMTYSACDWMLTARHRGKWPYRTVEDLKRKIADDPWLCREGGAQVVLLHDQDETVTVARELLSFMIAEGFSFLPFTD